MSLSSGHPEGNEHMDSTESSISNILKLILNLSPEKVKGSQALTGLRVIREAIDRLIADASRAELLQPEEASERQQQTFASGERLSFHSAPDSEQSESEHSYWRTKRKTQTQKDEKKARLAKREELIRQLRNRVSENFKNDSQNTSTAGETSSDNLNSNNANRFSIRLQRASFWPTGSVEWARQLLGIELGMTEKEKRQCYIEMVKLCHPDHNEQAGADAIQMVNSAWELLR